MLCVSLLCLIWGSTWLVIREGLRDLPPFTSAGARFAVAAAVMALLARRLAAREGGAAPGLRITLALGGLCFGASYGIVYWTETRLPSGLVSVLWAVFPMLMAAAGHVALPGERLRPRQWTGFAAGFAGVVVLFRTDLAAIGPGAVSAGAVLLLSPLVSAVGTVVVKREGAGVSSLLLNRNGMALGAVLLLALAAATERDAPARWSGAAVASVLYLAIAGTVVTFGLYYWVMRYAPASRLSLIAYVTPAIALSLGAAVGDEPVGWHTVAGAALVLGGVAAVLRARVPEPEQHVASEAEGHA